jgi:hypothetical protein
VSRSLAAALLVAALASAAPAGTVLVPIEFRQVVADATVIVRGRVTDVRGVIVPGAGIDSVVTVAVDAVLKGQAGAFVSVRLPGGQVGRTRTVMIGAPGLKVLDHVVLFLKPGPERELRPVGLSAGVFMVQPDPKSGRPVVASPGNGAQPPPNSRVGRPVSSRTLVPVSEFESMVKLVIAAPKAVRRTAGGR